MTQIDNNLDIGDTVMRKKIINKILDYRNDNNIDFNDLLSLLNQFGFNNRIKGDHFIFFKKGIDEIINIQPKQNKAKPYQVKQIRNIIIKYNLGRWFYV